MRIRVIGGGLAGPEAALVAARMGSRWTSARCARCGRPRRMQTGGLWRAGLLQLAEVREREYRALAAEAGDAARGSPLLRLRGRECRARRPCAGGGSRRVFAAHRRGDRRRAAHPVHREEVTELDPERPSRLSPPGPLTLGALARRSRGSPDGGHLAFYDSISPIVDADSIDRERVYFAARYDKGTADYINCPMTSDEYDRFTMRCMAAESAEAKEWEKLEYFEGCLPIEELARRGRDTLRFGPMKPVGLRDPRTGKMPWAVVQLRSENLRADSL